MRRRLALLLLAGLACTATACRGDDNVDPAPTIAHVGVAFYPIADIVSRLHLDVEPVVLVPPGQEAHEYDPTPKDLTRLEGTKVFFYLGRGFQPNVESAIASLPSSVRRVDLLEGLTLLPVTDPLAGTHGATSGETLDGNKDPHVWLDPANMGRMASTIVDNLVANGLTTAAAGAAGLTGARVAYGRLDQDFHDGLADCARHELVTTHRAFGYLADAYGLTQVSIAGVSPSEEPSAKTLEAVGAFVDTHGVTTIFSERNLPADLAATVADETGVVTATLDTVESPSRRQLANRADYLTLMDQNLHALRAALGCT
jgi:zinc transport system substrate-binding protein